MSTELLLNTAQEIDFQKRANLFWDFIEFPFSLSPNPKFMYLSPQFRNVVERTLDSIDSGGGFSAVWGDYGMGKTSIAYYIRDVLETSRPQYIIHFIPSAANPLRKPITVYRTLLSLLQVSPHRNMENNYSLLNGILLSLFEQKKRPVFIIDEAHEIPPPSLLALREITNIETYEEKLAQFVLFGSTEIFSKLQRVRSVQNRLVTPSLLSPFVKKDTMEMIQYRLHLAGRPDFISPKLGEYVHSLSKGHPRNTVRIVHDATQIALQNKLELLDEESITLSYKSLQEATEG